MIYWDYSPRRTRENVRRWDKKREDLIDLEAGLGQDKSGRFLVVVVAHQTRTERTALYVQVSHMACSQHGSRKAFIASLLQMAHRSLMGIS